MKCEYEDIINLPHHVSQNHPQMSMVSRAAQFSSFAALTGYEDAVRETADIVENADDTGYCDDIEYPELTDFSEDTGNSF